MSLENEYSHDERQQPSRRFALDIAQQVSQHEKTLDAYSIQTLGAQFAGTPIGEVFADKLEEREMSASNLLRGIEYQLKKHVMEYRITGSQAFGREAMSGELKEHPELFSVNYYLNAMFEVYGWYGLDDDDIELTYEDMLAASAAPIRETGLTLHPEMQFREEDTLHVDLTTAIPHDRQLLFHETRSTYHHDPDTGNVLVETEVQHSVFDQDSEGEWHHRGTLPFKTLTEYPEDPELYVASKRAPIEQEIAELVDAYNALTPPYLREGYSEEGENDGYDDYQLEKNRAEQHKLMIERLRKEISLWDITPPVLQTVTVKPETSYPTAFFNPDNTASNGDTPAYKITSQRTVYARLPKEHDDQFDLYR